MADEYSGARLLLTGRVVIKMGLNLDKAKAKIKVILLQNLTGNNST